MIASHGMRPHLSTSGGFTLLEVLLTSLLASIVLVALWTLSDIYQRMFISGDRQIKETELVRGVTQQVARDLSQVIQLPPDDSLQQPFSQVSRFPSAAPGAQGFSLQARRVGAPQGPAPAAGMPQRGVRPLPPIASENEQSAPGRDRETYNRDRETTNRSRDTGTRDREPSSRNQGSGATDQVSDSDARQAERSKPRFGLFGTKQALRLIVLQTDPNTAREITDLAEVLPQPGQIRPAIATELRTIEYSFSGLRDSGTGTSQHPPGLVRREWAWETWMGVRMSGQLTADSASGMDMMPDNQAPWTAEDLLALGTDKKLYHVPQVIDIEFSYYDGTEWDTEWNSWERQGLPTLVEVMLQIKVNKEKLVPDVEDEFENGSEGSLSAAGEDANGGKSRGTSGDGLVYRKLIHLPFAGQSSSTQTRPFENSRRESSTISSQPGAIQP